MSSCTKILSYVFSARQLLLKTYAWKSIIHHILGREFFIICLKEEKKQLTINIRNCWIICSGNRGSRPSVVVRFTFRMYSFMCVQEKEPVRTKQVGGCRFIVTSPTFYSGTEGFVGSIYSVMRLSSPEKLQLGLFLKMLKNDLCLLFHNKRPLVVMQVLTGGWSERLGLFDFNTWDRYVSNQQTKLLSSKRLRLYVIFMPLGFSH